jgi:PhzF family phenazine biosynthesis protein
MRRRFHQVDVFTSTPMLGNPLAVVHDAEGLGDDRMAAFARWTNLSETTFLLPPTDPAADYRVRILLPNGELPFAGHPTLGSCFAWLPAGGVPRRREEVVQQCGVGLVRIRRDGDRLAFAAPPTQVEAVDPSLLERVVVALGLPPGRVRSAAWLTNGPRQLALELDEAHSVLSMTPDHAALATLCDVGVVGRHPAGSDIDLEVRFFVPLLGVPEDPVTGSFNASIARWMMADGRMPRRYVARQGKTMGRDGRIHLHDDGDQLWVGGEVIPLVEGMVALA